MQCCGKRGINGRVINPLRVAASRQAHMIWASVEVATAAVPIYCSSDRRVCFLLWGHRRAADSFKESELEFYGPI